MQSSEEKKIREWVGEILIAGFNGLEMNNHAERLIRHHKVRNIIFFSRNISSVEQVRNLAKQLNDAAQYPLIICTDQENGIVRRVAPGLPGLPGNMAVGATKNVENAYLIGLATAHQLLSVGINMNLAPDLDVNNNSQNPVIGVRSYGEDPDLVARFGERMIEAMQESGVITCGKHFPGHGDTTVDSHISLPVIPHNLERLEAVELVPFQKAIRIGVDVIMTAHVIFPSVEPECVPATISKRVLTDFLRGKLGYQGVITTDCLEMNAISETIGVGEGAIRALQAGADMIMVSHRLDRQEEAIDSIVHAVLDGKVPSSRLEDAANRVKRLRKHRVKKFVTTNTFNLNEVYKEAFNLQQKICSNAVTIVSNTDNLLPFHKDSLHNVAVYMDETAPHMSAADPNDSRSLLADSIKKILPKSNVMLHVVSKNTPPQFEYFEQSGLTVAGLNGTQNENYITFLKALIKKGKPVVIVSLQSPYDLSALPEAKTTLAIYEYTQWMVEAGVKAIFGGIAAGSMPVTYHEPPL